MSILPAKIARTRLDEEDLPDELFPWTDRDSYLAWVAEWKAELKLKITEIRRSKAIMRDPERSDTDRAVAQSDRHYLRIETANMFLLRRIGKERSIMQKRQRLAA